LDRVRLNYNTLALYSTAIHKHFGAHLHADPAKMGILVLEAEDADMERICEIGSLAFARNEPMWDL